LINYNRNDWWRTCLAWRGTVLPHVLARVGLLTAFCLGLCFLNTYLRDFNGAGLPALDQLGHSVLGVAMSLLIVFRTQSSNGRFWEARTLWGALVNNSRSVVRIGAVYAGPADDLARIVAAYVLAIKQTLRDDRDLSELRPLLTGAQFDQLKEARNPPSVVARFMSEWVRRRQKEGRLDPITAMAMEGVIVELVAAQGGCERIHLTPLPFVYAGLIKQLLLVYLVTLPFVLIPPMSFAAPLVEAVVSFAMLGIEEAGVEIEDPFGVDPNHLSIEQICQGIARDAARLAEEKAD
jgi:ion channel-forming bestrophin family protein